MCETLKVVRKNNSVNQKQKYLVKDVVETFNFDFEFYVYLNLESRALVSHTHKYHLALLSQNR